MGKNRNQTNQSATPDPEVAEQIDGEPTEDTAELAPTEPGPVDGLTPTESVAGPIGGSDNYAYLDQTRTPLHDRDMPMDSNTEASQAELNPAFTPKAEDGGPVNANGDGIGTAPNADDLALAAAENSGRDGAVEEVQEQIDAGKEDQIDAEAVQADAEEKAPEGIDASTGQREDATPES